MLKDNLITLDIPCKSMKEHVILENWGVDDIRSCAGNIKAIFNERNSLKKKFDELHSEYCSILCRLRYAQKHVKTSDERIEIYALKRKKKSTGNEKERIKLKLMCTREDCKNAIICKRLIKKIDLKTEEINKWKIDEQRKRRIENGRIS